MIPRWSSAATRDLEAIYDSISAERSEEVAAKQITRLIKAVGGLQRFPQLGRTAGPAHSRQLVVGHYRVSYRITGGETGVIIDAILHGARRLY